MENDVITDIAGIRGCTNAQVVLAWGMKRGISVIPKSAHAERIVENKGSEECVLHGEDFERILELGGWERRFNKPGKAWGVELYRGLEDPDT